MAEDGYEYTFIENPNQKIHLLKIDLNKYNISIASAHNTVFGREKTGDIAQELGDQFLQFDPVTAFGHL